MLVAAVILMGSLFSYAQDQDPSSIWYRAFLTYESTLELEKQGKYLEALNKCNEAKTLYDGLAYQHPQFQPEIVKYKRQVVADTRLRIIDANRRRQRGEAPRPNLPPPPTQQALPGNRELPSVGSPGSGSVGSLPSYEQNRGTQINQPSTPPQYYDGPKGSGNVLPSWSPNPIVGRAANEMLEDVRRQEDAWQSQMDRLSRENRQLKAERDAYERRLNQVEEELSYSRRKEAEYQRQLELTSQSPGNQAQKINQYKALLKQTMDQLAAANQLNERLVGQLRAAREKIRIQDEQISRLKAERDNLASIIEGKGLGTQALRDLMEQNRRLAQRLDLAEKVAMKTADDNKQKERDIAVLKSEIAKVKVERDKLVDENAQHQVQIENLHRKLEMLSDGLDETDREKLARMAPEQRAENELLRSMVLKQLRRQAQQKQAKELLLRQLDRVGARSSALLEIVEDIARGPQLSPEEKALFRAPQLAELIDSASSPMTAEDPGVYNGTLAAPAAGNPVANQKLEVELSQLDKSARLDFKEGRYAEAEIGFNKYLHYRPKSVPCLCNLGVLKLALKNYTEAENYLQKAIAIDRDSGRAHYLLGRTYFLQNRHDEALQHLQQGLTLEPNNAKAHNCIGVIASQKGWVARAEKAFSYAVKIEPKFGDAHFNLAVLFSSMDQPDAQKAGFHYFKALDLGIPRDAAIEDFLKKSATTIGKATHRRTVPHSSPRNTAVGGQG